MKNLIYILILVSSIQLFAQKQTAFWYFGTYAGLDFNSGNPIALTDGQLNTDEGCTAISDFNGNLLFYTDGVTVWNKNHVTMLNGENLNGHFSSTNSAIIIPKPTDSNIYYIFTVDDVAGPKGLQYSEVDMQLDGGLGGVTGSKNIILFPRTLEKVTAVKHQNDVDWWVLAHKWNSNEFTAYRVTSNGINPAISSSVGLTVTGDTENSVGCMKFSPNGKKVAIAHSYQNNIVQLLSFDDITGNLSNPITLTGFSGTTGAYGVEFSPNSELLYVSDSDGSIYQYNTQLPTPTDIINSKTTILDSTDHIGALQLAPNEKIYVAKLYSNHLGVISSPNLAGVGSNYIDEGVNLDSGISKLGLPPFIQSFFWKEVTAEPTCFGENTTFTLTSPEVSQLWNFDDPASGINNTSTAVNPTHIFTSPGTYSVTVEVTNAQGNSSITTVTVIISETPTANTPTNYMICDDDTDGDNENGIVQSFLLSSKDNEILGIQDSNQYDVFYYDDVNLTNIINKTLDYENITANTQTIYAKIFNKKNDSCFDTTQFELVINTIPSFDLENEKVVCSNNFPETFTIENSQGNYNFLWLLDNGDVFATGDSIILNSNTNIPQDGLSLTVTATDNTTNCTNSKSTLVKKFTPIQFTQNDIIISDISNNSTITIQSQDLNFNSSDYEYAIEDAFGNLTPFQSSVLFEHVSPGIKKIHIKDIYDCSITIIEVSIVGFPKFLTPNNDGINDTWQIIGASEYFYTSALIRIFDRFGKTITILKSNNESWNGLYNGKKLPSNDFWFSAELIDVNGIITKRKGHFSLIRK